MLTGEQSNYLKGVADNLNDAFALRQYKTLSFRLKSPRSITVKDKNSSYRKVAAKGDEEFGVSTAYVGKTDLIVVFVPKKPHFDFKFMEVKYSEVHEFFEEDFLGIFAGVMQGDIPAAVPVIPKTELENMRLSDPRYGAW